jgi:succinate dehydrogenase / fumarate reductase cytochrome b subunit
MSTGTSQLSTTTAQHGVFMRQRLGSLLAFFPLGIWVVLHLWNNLAAFQGPEAWQSAVTEYSHPYSQLFAFVVVLVPVVLHTLWGIQRLSTARPNNGSYGFYGNLKYLLQRLTAIGLLLFIGAHLWLACLHPRLAEGHAEQFADIACEMHYHLPTLLVYLLGTLAVAFHLGNGVQTFAMGWGLVSSKKALMRLDKFALLGFFVLLALSWGAIYALWAAGGAAPNTCAQ